MSTITREQLIKDLKASTQNSSGMFEIGEETICALVSLLTAPPAPASVPDRSMFEKWWESEHGSPLDSWDSLRTTDGYCDDGIDGQFEAWNACRAALLHGAENAESRCSNSPVIQDGWVLVPKEPTPDMLNAAWVSHGIYHASAYRTMLAAAPQQVK